MTPEQLENLMADIAARLTAVGEQFDEAKLRRLIAEQLPALMGDPAFARKMRFAASPAPLIGTKYARFGLGVADIEFLFDLQLSLQGQKRVNNSGVYSGPSDELARTFQAISAAVYLPEDEVRKIDQRAIDDLFPRLPLAAFSPADRALAARGAWEQTEAYRRAMDSAESGYGNQLIGAQYVGDLWEGARRDSRIFNLIPSFEMTDPTAYLPVEADLPEMLLVAENTANNSSDYGTVKSGSNRVTVTAKKMIIHQMWSGELEEDSILPFVPFIRRQAELALAHYTDSAVFNGDTTNAATGNINLDDADPADTKHYLAFDGIRHAALVDNTGNAVNAGGAGYTFAALHGLKTKMIDRTYLMDWGHPAQADDLIYVVDPESGDKIALLPEVTTVDKIGNQASILTGQVARLGGHPVVGSMAAPLTEADGKVSTTASNNTLGQATLFNRRAFVAGWRRRVRVETERLPARDQTRIIHSLRLGFGRFTPTGAASGIEAASVLYNVAVS